MLALLVLAVGALATVGSGCGGDRPPAPVAPAASDVGPARSSAGTTAATPITPVGAAMADGGEGSTPSTARGLLANERPREVGSDAGPDAGIGARPAKPDAGVPSEAEVKAEFTRSCGTGRRELEAFCDCSWIELRKRLGVSELADDGVPSERIRSARSAVAKTCAPRKPEGISREVFLRACLRDPADDAYCGCVWKELRKQASPAEIEAGTFGQSTLFSQFERTCSKLRAVRTAP